MKKRRPVPQSWSLAEAKKTVLPTSSMLCGLNKEERKTCPAILFNALFQKQRSKEDLSCHPLQCSFAEAKKKIRPVLQSSSMLFGRSKEDCPANLVNDLWQK
jgi:hypothetical protein